ncbi:MAG: hypothetical protein M1834_009258 [Cirrosporium novae-zelandiae]|nr:MAG: hypothetical protein M1834_009258 [Cirrosporium novae-zelandiae]
MSGLKAGDSFPADVVFEYIPYLEENADFHVCGIPQKYKASEEFANKKVVLFSLPGAFTPTCSANHVPGYIKHLAEIKAKGVDVVGVLAYNDPYVMDGWAKANGVKNNDIYFFSDPEAKFSKSIGWTLGERTARYGLIIDHGKVTYAALEKAMNALEVSDAETILKHL